jgi:dTDP-4-amino-4,6-dideoxygalactose transaminase
VNGEGSLAACFSFYATKNLTAGEGGALVTDDEDLASFARSYRLHGLSADAWALNEPGRPSAYELMAPGIKANLPDVLAAIARSQLARFDDMQAQRRRLVERYRGHLAALEQLRVLPPKLVEGSADHLMVIELAEGIDRSRLQAKLANEGVTTSIHFQPLHRFRWFQENALMAAGGMPVAEGLADRVLSLPLSSALTESQVDRVCEQLREALSASATASATAATNAPAPQVARRPAPVTADT